MANEVRTTRRRRIRHDSMDGASRGPGARKRLFRFRSWLNARATAITGTGTAQTISAVNAGSNELTITAHGRVAGDGPYTCEATTTVPAGLVGLLFYVSAPNANTLKAHPTKEDAINGTAEIDITSAGAGVITLEPGETFDTIINLMRDGVKIPAIQAATDVDSLIG